GAPQLIVVATPGVQADDQTGSAEARGVGVDIVRQIARTTLLRAFDQDDDPSVRLTVVLQSLHRGQCCEHGIAIVSSSTAIEPAIGIEVWRPWSQVVTPSYHGRLLVQVTVHQHRVRDSAWEL